MSEVALEIINNPQLTAACLNSVNSVWRRKRTDRKRRARRSGHLHKLREGGSRYRESLVFIVILVFAATAPSAVFLCSIFPCFISSPSSPPFSSFSGSLCRSVTQPSPMLATVPPSWLPLHCSSTVSSPLSISTPSTRFEDNKKSKTTGAEVRREVSTEENRSRAFSLSREMIFLSSFLSLPGLFCISAFHFRQASGSEQTPRAALLILAWVERKKWGPHNPFSLFLSFSLISSLFPLLSFRLMRLCWLLGVRRLQLLPLLVLAWVEILLSQFFSISVPSFFVSFCLRLFFFSSLFLLPQAGASALTVACEKAPSAALLILAHPLLSALHLNHINRVRRREEKRREEKSHTPRIEDLTDWEKILCKKETEKQRERELCEKAPYWSSLILFSPPFISTTSIGEEEEKSREEKRGGETRSKDDYNKKRRLVRLREDPLQERERCEKKAAYWFSPILSSLPFISTSSIG